MKTLAAILLGCGALALTLPAFGQRTELSADALKTAKDGNTFACDLYGKLGAQPGNLFFSPYSISSALAMTYGGAKGDTATCMAKTLHFDLDADRLHPAYAQLYKAINAADKNRKYQLTTANMLWGQKNYGFDPNFLKLTSDNYGAGLKELDLAGDSEASRKTINAWVEEQTKEKIKDLLPQGSIHADSRLVLTNAIYFKAAWMNAFPKGATKDEDFHVSADKKVKAPLMHVSEKMPYHGAEDFQAVSIPYEQNELSMVVLLPKKVDGLAALEKGLTAEKLEQLHKQMRSAQVNLTLPKFKMTEKFGLKQTLSEMGMAKAFTRGADFSGITSKEKLFIDDVIHKAFVAVDEKGTEAAAATAVTIRTTSAVIQPEQPVNFRADRPFMFLIRDSRSGAILFMGRVANPT